MIDAQTIFETDQQWMAACLRLARRHRGLTGTNPSVGTLLVSEGKVVGKGITAKGGRPHAERQAIDRAGAMAKGSTAYVSLEPCAHHGATPPCAQALIDAGVARVVTAWIDPDHRVDGKGHTMLREASMDVDIGVLASTAEADLRGYLCRKQLNRPKVTLKLAVSKNGKLGVPGEEVAITGQLARNMVHRLRAEHDGILVGRGTVDSDDPDLTCRLHGLEHRSPVRFILDSDASLRSDSQLAKSARTIPVNLITSKSDLPNQLQDAGVTHFIADSHNGKLALPEVLEDMAETGISSLMVEGGAEVARSFLDAGLVDELIVFTGPKVIEENGIESPVQPSGAVEGFQLIRTLELGDDTMRIFDRT